MTDVCRIVGDRRLWHIYKSFKWTWFSVMVSGIT